MRHHHVAVGAGLLVEGRALAQAERLGHVDLDMVDEVAVPDRLEQAVGEAEREDVLRRLLAEEMVDAVDLLLGEDLVQPRIERDGALQVGAEGLLHDDARALDQAGRTQQAHRRQRRARGHAQVVQPAALGAQVLLGGLDRRAQRLRPGRQRHIVEAGGEVLPVRLGHPPAGELVERAARLPPEGLDIDVVERHADDAAAGNEAGRGQVVQAGQQLAPGQVAGGAEQDDDLRKARTDAGGDLGQDRSPLGLGTTDSGGRRARARVGPGRGPPRFSGSARRRQAGGQGLDDLRRRHRAAAAPVGA